MAKNLLTHISGYHLDITGPSLASLMKTWSNFINALQTLRVFVNCLYLAGICMSKWWYLASPHHFCIPIMDIYEVTECSRPPRWPPFGSLPDLQRENPPDSRVLQYKLHFVHQLLPTLAESHFDVKKVSPCSAPPNNTVKCQMYMSSSMSQSQGECWDCNVGASDQPAGGHALPACA